MQTEKDSGGGGRVVLGGLKRFVLLFLGSKQKKKKAVVFRLKLSRMGGGRPQAFCVVAISFVPLHEPQGFFGSPSAEERFFDLPHLPPCFQAQKQKEERLSIHPYTQDSPPRPLLSQNTRRGKPANQQQHMHTQTHLHVGEKRARAS
jgi:hypothetical protein